jgi:hypothetical protein
MTVQVSNFFPGCRLLSATIVVKSGLMYCSNALNSYSLQLVLGTPCRSYLPRYR